MTHAVAHPPTVAYSLLYWKGIKAHVQADVTLHRSEAATWPSRAKARAAVDQRAPWLWRMGYEVVEVKPTATPHAVEARGDGRFNVHEVEGCLGGQQENSRDA